jgi:hypothetical protein
MYAEWFCNTNASGPSQSMPRLSFSYSRSVRNVFHCARGRRRQCLMLRKGRLHMQIVWKRISALVRRRARIDGYPQMTLSTALRVRSVVTLGLKSHDCALSAVLSPRREMCGWRL